MKLLTKAIEKSLPALYSTEHVPESEKMVLVKFFNPAGAGTWYGLEYDPESRIFFGYVTGLGFNELGNFSLDELSGFRGRFGLGIERDLHFTPTRLSEIIAKEG